MKKSIVLFAMALPFFLVSCSQFEGEGNTTDGEAVNISEKSGDTLQSSQVISEREKQAFKVDPKASYSETIFPFDTWLSEVADSAITISNSRTLDSLRFASSLVNDDDVSPPLVDLADIWALSSCSKTVVEGCIPDRLEGKRTYFIASKDSRLLTTQDIFEIFNLDEKQDPAPQFPSTTGRVNQWTAIFPDRDRLLVRYVNSYPDGGQTCFYREYLYRFTREHK